DHPAVATRVGLLDLLPQLWIDVRALFRRPTQCAPPFRRAPGLPPLAPAAHNELVRLLVAPGPVPERRLTPRRSRLAADRRLALTTAVRVVGRVHGRTPRDRPPAKMPRATGLTDPHVLVVHIADLAQRRHAVQPDHAHLARGHSHLGVAVL